MFVVKLNTYPSLAQVVHMQVMNYVVSKLTIVTITHLLSYIPPVVTLPFWEMLRISLQPMLVFASSLNTLHFCVGESFVEQD